MVDGHCHWKNHLDNWPSKWSDQFVVSYIWQIETHLTDDSIIIVYSPHPYFDKDTKAMVFKFDYKDGIDTSKLVGQLALPTNSRFVQMTSIFNLTH